MSITREMKQMRDILNMLHAFHFYKRSPNSGGKDVLDNMPSNYTKKIRADCKDPVQRILVIQVMLI